MDVQQLRYVLAVVETGTFTAAAKRTFVAQPSLSESVRNLERELGVELFARVGRRVRLTAAGEALVPAAREAVRSFDAVRHEVAATVGLIAGHLDLVTLPTLAAEPVAGMVGRFRVAHPEVIVRISHPDGTEGLVESVRRGESEVGVTEVPASDDGLAVRPLGRQEIVAVLPPGSRPRRRIRPGQLAELPLVAQPVGTSTRALVDATLAQVGAKARIAVETDHRELIVPLVLGGAGAALLPRPMAALAERDGAVVVALEPALWRTLAVIHRRATLSPAARAFVDAL